MINQPQQMVAYAAKTLAPLEHEMMVFQTMAKQAVGSKLYRGIGDEFAIMTIMLTARELDIPPMAALNGGINIINGKTEISARMMAALIIRRGHTISVEESTDQKCVLKGMRSNGQTAYESFTIEEAKLAGLIKEGGGWKKWPKDMCYARCLSRLARRLFPDVIGMGYVEGEIYESASKPVLETDVEIHRVESDPKVEEVRKDPQEMLKNFLSRFDKEQAEGWGNYIVAVTERLDLPLESFIAKYEESPAVVTERYQKWAGKNLKTT